MFERLPAVAPERRRESARSWIERSAGGDEAELRAAVVQDALRIIEDPEFADLFASETFAEAPIAAVVGEGIVVAGTVDRLLVRDDRVLVADFKTGRKKGVIAIIGLLLAVAAIGVVVLVSLDTSNSQIVKDAEKMQIDPDMLVLTVADPMARVNAAVEIVPEGASVVVNGLLVDVQGGQIPLVQGVKNEVVTYADGHIPQRVYLDGEGSTSPVSIKLEPAPPADPAKVADLQVVTEPRDALIYVDGKQVGTSPMLIPALDASYDHHVHIQKDGHFGYAGLVGLVPKSENLIDVTLHPADSARKSYVEVVFSAIPRGATVRVDGEQVGATKSFKNYDRNQNIVVEFDEADSAPARYHVLLEDVGVMELRPFLKTMKREKGTVSVAVEPLGPQLYVGPNAYGTGPAEDLSFPAGNVTIVLDSPASGRSEATVEVLPNTHVDYVLHLDANGKVTVEKK